MKLGKSPAAFDGRTLKLSRYLDVPKLPPLPVESDWFEKVSQFGMAGNKDYGDCVLAGAAHMIQTWTANAGRREISIPDRKVVDTYLKLTGGQDTGLNMLAFLNYWRQTGVFGSRIGAFVSINPRKITQMRYANWLFGGVFLGLMLPNSARDQEVWDVPAGGPVGAGEPDSWGGHCVNVGRIGRTDYQVGTWGTKQKATPLFIATYADEAYAILTLEWFGIDHKTPAGFAWKDLKSDLEKVTQ